MAQAEWGTHKMNKDTMHKLATQLLDCQDERKKQHDTIERLREQLTESGRHHKTAVNNAYAEGYEAGLQAGRHARLKPQ